MVKLKDIAEELNISISTVSRVVNNKDRVNPETRRRVMKALNQRNYRPNEAARSLKNQRTSAIGLVVPDITNKFFANLIKGLENIVQRNKYTLILCNSDEDAQREQEHLELLLHKQITGLVLTTVSDNTAYIEKYSRAGIPIVFVDNLPRTEANIDFVIIDNRRASYDLVNHLIEIGHKKIGIIAGPLNETSGEGTFEGWKRALSDHGLEMRKEWIGRGNFKLDSGYEQMNHILKLNDAPTAIFAANNQMAYGAIKAIHEHGLKIPDDMAIVTFDTRDETGLMQPRLTAIIEPAEEIGRYAGEVLFRKLNNPEGKAFERIILEPQLQIGSSCGYASEKPVR